MISKQSTDWSVVKRRPKLPTLAIGKDDVINLKSQQLLFLAKISWAINRTLRSAFWESLGIWKLWKLWCDQNCLQTPRSFTFTSKRVYKRTWQVCHWFCEVWLKVLKLFCKLPKYREDVASWPLCLRKGACFLACLEGLKVDCSLVQGTGLWMSKLLAIWRSCRRLVACLQDVEQWK